MGYGDVNAETDLEKIVSIIWMLFGVGFYSFTIGQLTSLMSNIDSRSKALQEKMLYVNQLTNEAQLPSETSRKLRKCLEYNANKAGFSLDQK